MEASPFPSSDEGGLAAALAATVRTHQAMLQSLQSGGAGGETGLDGQPTLPLRGPDRDEVAKRMRTDPLGISKERWDTARVEARVEEGMPFSARLFGDRVLAKYFKGHSTLERIFEMLAAIHRYQWTGQHAEALCQTTQCIKAVSACAKAGGVWKGAWSYTMLADINESNLAIPMRERAANSRHMLEQERIDAIIEKARKEKDL